VTLTAGRLFCLPPACFLVLAEIIFSTLKMEAICSSETSVATQQTTRRHIPEDDTLHKHRCENLKSYTKIYFTSQFRVPNFHENGDSVSSFLLVLDVITNFFNHSVIIRGFLENESHFPFK
jgi:hypothetical protein